MKHVIKFKELNIFLALAVMVVALGFYDPKSFLSGYNLALLSKEIATYGLLAFGVTFVILTGGIDLSPGSIVVLTSIITASLLAAGVPFFLALPAVLIISCLIGSMHGFFVSKLGVPPFIITLGTLSIGRAAANIIVQTTSGGMAVIGLPDGFSVLWNGSFVGLPIPFIIFIAVLFVAGFILRFTVLGRHIYAVGGNLEAARLSGVRVDRVRIFCYLFSALMAGLVGILLTAKLNSGQPSIGNMYELIAIAAAVIGGISLSGGEGSIAGPLLGASIMSVLKNGLVILSISPYWHDAVIGCVLVLAVTIDVLQRRYKTGKL